MGQPIEITRTDLTATELRAAAAKFGDAAVVRRLLAITLLLEGHSRTAVAEMNAMTRQTLRDWVHRYNDEGVAGLRSRTGPGRTPVLTDAQMAELKEIESRAGSGAAHRDALALLRSARGERGAMVRDGLRTNRRAVAASVASDPASAEALSSEEGPRGGVGL